MRPSEFKPFFDRPPTPREQADYKLVAAGLVLALGFFLYNMPAALSVVLPALPSN